MAENARPTGKYGCDPPAFLRQNRVADRINSAMERVKSSVREAVIDCTAPNTERRQLPARYNAMLPLCQRRNQMINATFAPYSVVNCRFVKHEAIVAG